MKISLTESGKDCLLTEFRVGPVFSLLKGMPGRNKWIDRNLAFQPTGANIAFILQHFPDAEWTGGSEILRDNWLSLKMKEENTRAEKHEDLVDESGYEYKTVPYAHQKQAFLLSRDRESFALFHEQGTGKTKTIIDTAAYLYEKGEIDTLIVLAKNGVHINWVLLEIPAHLPDRIPFMAAYYTADMPKSEYRSLFAGAETMTGMLRMMTFHIEGMNADKAREMLTHWLENSRAMVVIDESSRIKNHSAQRTKFIVKAGKLAKYRRIMTGTPVTSGIENLYTQFLFLDPKILGYESFYTFRNAFCIMGGFEGRSIVSYKNTEELIRIVDGHSHRVLKKDCLDLPPKVYRRSFFEMEGEQRKMYEAYRKNAIEELQHILGEEDGLKRAMEISIVRALRLHQIACHMTPSEKPERLPGVNTRIVTLMEELEEYGDHKVIIWVRFRLDQREIASLLGARAVGYYGEIPEAQRPSNVHRFVNDEKVRYLVASSAAAYGLSLPAAGAVYHSQTSSLDLRLQSEDRCHGINRTVGPTTTYTDLEAMEGKRSTVDRKIINTLRRQKSLADQITRDPISLFMEEEVYEPTA
jgi:hypothetical protein